MRWTEAFSSKVDLNIGYILESSGEHLQILLLRSTEKKKQFQSLGGSSYLHF